MPSRDDEPSPDQPRHRRHSSRSESRRHRAAEKVPEVRATDRGGASLALPGFNTPLKRIRIHPLETTLLWVVAAHLVFLPWALGTMHLWAQLVSLTLAVAGFAIALVPREYTEDESTTGSFRMIPVRRLWRFPIFWLGLALLALITIQGLNPAWAYQTNGKDWWMVAIPHVQWLPSGVLAPFNGVPGTPYGGPWRNLLIYTSAFLVVSSIWAGITRRKSLHTILYILVVNGVTLSILGIAERAAGNGKLFWLYPSPNPSFFSTFIYKNHAGAYLDLIFATTLALTAHRYLKDAQRLSKSSPAGLLAFLATVISAAIFVSYARGATLVLFLYMAIAAALILMTTFRHILSNKRQTLPSIILAILLLGFAGIILSQLRSDWIWDYIGRALSGRDASVEARGIADLASLDMLKSNWALGVGSGDFRFLFPIYQQHYPQIAHRQYWEYAHNDLLEFPIELGIVGTGILATTIFYWIRVILKNKLFRHIEPLLITVGLLGIVGMSIGDFVFENPAVLVTWLSLATITCELVIFSEHTTKPKQ